VGNGRRKRGMNATKQNKMYTFAAESKTKRSKEEEEAIHIFMPVSH